MTTAEAADHRRLPQALDLRGPVRDRADRLLAAAGQPGAGGLHPDQQAQARRRRRRVRRLDHQGRQELPQPDVRRRQAERRTTWRPDRAVPGRLRPAGQGPVRRRRRRVQREPRRRRRGPPTPAVAAAATAAAAVRHRRRRRRRRPGRSPTPTATASRTRPAPAARRSIDDLGLGGDDGRRRRRPSAVVATTLAADGSGGPPSVLTALVVGLFLGDARRAGRRQPHRPARRRPAR